MSDTPDPPSSCGQVDGSEDPDIIDDQYTGDPEGDVVDGEAAGPSDVIFAGSGEDTVFASAGADTIDGGSDRDTYIVGPLLLADPVVTTAEFTTTDLSGTGYPFGAPEDPVVIRRFTLERGEGAVGDDDATTPSLGGENFFDPDAPITLRITSLPTINDVQIGTLYVDRAPAETTDSWSVVSAEDAIDLDDELVWVLSDAEAALLTAADREVTFQYQAETEYEGVTRTAAGQVSLSIPDTAPEVDPVLALPELSPPFLDGFPGSDPAYDVNFDVIFGPGAVADRDAVLDGNEFLNRSPAENAGSDTADLGAFDDAGSLATPVFEIINLPDYGVLYIDTDPGDTEDEWEVAQARILDQNGAIEQRGSIFTDVNNLRWVIQEPGVAAVLQAEATQTTFDYSARFAGTESPHATVTIDLTGLALANGSLADDVLTNAVVVDPEAAESTLPDGFPIGTPDDPVIQFRSFTLDGALDGGLDEAGRETAPTLGGLSANAVPLPDLTFRITSLPQVGSLVVERDVDGTTEFLDVAQPGFEVRPTDRLHWAATQSEAVQLPADGQVLFNYVLVDDVGPASAPAVVRIDVLEADPVLTFVDAVPRFDANFLDDNLAGREPVIFKTIEVGAQADSTPLDGDLTVLEPLTGDPADLAGVSGEFGSDALIYRVTSLPQIGSLWVDQGSDVVSRDGSLGQGWIQIDESNLETITLSDGDRLYWLADYDDFARETQTTVIGNPLDGSGVPQVDNIALSEWEDPEFADGSASALTVRFSGRDFDGSPAEVVTLPVDADGNLIDTTSQDYQDLLDSLSVEGLGTPIVKSGIGLAGRSPGSPDIFDDVPVRDSAFYNQVAEINSGFGDFADTSQTLVVSLSAPAVGTRVHVSNLFEYEGEYGFAEAFLRGESVARIYFGYPNPFDEADPLPPGIQDEIDAGTAYFQALTPQARNGLPLRDENGDPLTFPDDPPSRGGIRPDEGNGLGRFDLTTQDGDPLYFDQLELRSLNSGLLLSDPQQNADTSDFYLHALEVTELIDPSQTSLQYQARDLDGQTTRATDILIDTNPPLADPVTTPWQTNPFNADFGDRSIIPANGASNDERSVAYEKIFTVDDLLDGSGLEPGQTVATFTQPLDFTLTPSPFSYVNPNGSASLGGTAPSGNLFYTIKTLPDFGVLQIGTDTNGDGSFEYVLASDGDTFTSANQVRHVVSIEDLVNEQRAVEDGGTGLQRGGYDGQTPGDSDNIRGAVELAGLKAGQSLDAIYENGEIGGTLTQEARNLIAFSRSNDILVGGTNTTDGALVYDPESGTSKKLVINYGGDVSHTRVTFPNFSDVFFRDPIYGQIEFYRDGERLGDMFFGNALADTLLQDRYQAAVDAGTELNFPNGIDLFLFREDLSLFSDGGKYHFQVSNEQILPDGTRLGLFDTVVISPRERADGVATIFDAELIVNDITFIRGRTSFGYSVTDAETGVESATQLVTIGTDAGESLFVDAVGTRFPSNPEIPAPGQVEAIHSIALSVGSGLDGDLNVPELPNAADLGALATDISEDRLRFFIKTLPDQASLFLDVGGNNPDNPTAWEEITEGQLSDGGTPRAFGVSDKIYVVVDSETVFVSDQDIADGTSVAISDFLSSDTDSDANGITAYVLSARQVEARPDSEGFNESLGYANVNSPGSDPATHLLSGADGIVTGSPTLGSGVENGDIIQNFGASDRAVIAFDEVAGRATLEFVGLGNDDNISTVFSGGNTTATNVTEGDELGFLTAFRGGQIVKQYYFGLTDPAGEGGPTDHPFLRAERISDDPDSNSELTIFEDGLSFDRLEITVWGFANGARTQVIESGSGTPSTWNAGFDIRSIEYHKVPPVEFEYTVATPDGRTADAAIAIDPPWGVEPDVIRLAVNNAPDTIEGDRAVFSVEVLNGPADADILVTLDIVDQLRYPGAFQGNRADGAD